MKKSQQEQPVKITIINGYQQDVYYSNGTVDSVSEVIKQFLLNYERRHLSLRDGKGFFVLLPKQSIESAKITIE